jgi:hypothetical protein
MQTTRGPIEVLGVGFDDQARFEGAIADELDRLERTGVAHVVAVLFVHKDASTSELEVLNVQADAAGDVTDALAEGGEGRAPSVMLSALGLTLDDVHDMAAGLPPGASAGFVLLEHLWARGLHDAIRATHGTPFLQGYLSAQTASELGA